jgi:cytochrome c553
MSGFAGQLSDKDIKELAAYYAAQRPSLDTVPKRNNRFFAR